MAVGYGRVSRVRQTIQILDQEASIRDFCAAEKLELVEMYDEGLSSGTSDKRPVLFRLMQRIREGKSGIGYLVVHSYSRLARDAFELERQRQCLELCGVQLVSITAQLPKISLRADILSDSAEPPVLRS